MRTRGAEKRPWASAIGMLTACGTVLIGVVCGIDPDVILLRAVTAALLVGSVSFCVIELLRSGTSENHRGSKRKL